MQKIITTLLLSVSVLGSAWARIVEPTNNMTVYGTMGEGTKFSLDLVLSGCEPGVVEGTTIYTHKNGSTSKIRVTGSIAPSQTAANGTASAYHVSLRENVNDKVCGNFDFDVPARGVNEELGLPVTGRWWLGEKELKFGDVRVNGFTYYGEKEEKKNDDVRALSGTFGYCYASAKDKKVLNKVTLSMVTGPDSTYYNLHVERDGESVTREFSSDGGYGKDPKHPKDCWTFHLGNVKYNVLTTGSTLYVYRANPKVKGINGLPKGVEIEGYYPRLTFAAFVRKEREEDGATLSCEQTLEIPDLEYPTCEYVNKWLSEQRHITDASTYYEMAETAAQWELEDLETWENMEPWQAPWVSDDIRGEVFNTSKYYINLSRSGTRYMGGAHGMPYRFTETMDRKTGHIMRWKDWFKNPEAIRAMVSKAMHEQNPETSFDADELSLPCQEPWYCNGEMLFMYQFYEAAPYSEGTPLCAIPLKDLLPYMTEYGKRVAKE